MESKRHLRKYDGGTQPVYVTNPEQRREFEILKAAGIYQISEEPTNARRLTLYPVNRCFRCANPLMLTFLTFGIVPAVLPSPYFFQYEIEIDEGRSKKLIHHLPLYERVSIWEWFVIDRADQKLAEALAWSQAEAQIK